VVVVVAAVTVAVVGAHHGQARPAAALPIPARVELGALLFLIAILVLVVEESRDRHRYSCPRVYELDHLSMIG